MSKKFTVSPFWGKVTCASLVAIGGLGAVSAIYNVSAKEDIAPLAGVLASAGLAGSGVMGLHAVRRREQANQPE